MNDHTEIIWKPLEPSGSIKTVPAQGMLPPHKGTWQSENTAPGSSSVLSSETDGKGSLTKRMDPGGPGEVMATTISAGIEPLPRLSRFPNENALSPG